MVYFSYPFITDPVQVPVSRASISAEDWILLDAMTASSIPSCTGRFLTIHKRRRKRLTTRSLAQDHAILDDIFHGQVQVSVTFIFTVIDTR